MSLWETKKGQHRNIFCNMKHANLSDYYYHYCTLWRKYHAKIFKVYFCWGSDFPCDLCIIFTGNLTSHFLILPSRFAIEEWDGHGVVLNLFLESKWKRLRFWQESTWMLTITIWKFNFYLSQFKSHMELTFYPSPTVNFDQRC